MVNKCHLVNCYTDLQIGINECTTKYNTYRHLPNLIYTDRYNRKAHLFYKCGWLYC